MRKIADKPEWDYSAKYLASTTQAHQGLENQGKPGKLSQTREDHADMTTDAMWCLGLDPGTEEGTSAKKMSLLLSSCVSPLCVLYKDTCH